MKLIVDISSEWDDVSKTRFNRWNVQTAEGGSWQGSESQ
jgi:hypothetical protein